MNQTLKDRFYSIGTKRHIKYVAAAGGMTDEEAAVLQLLNEKRDKVLRSYVIEKDAALLFPYLKEGKYSIRITEDLNRNGIVDTGNLLEHRQPEKVRFYKLRDGSFLITIKESTEMEQKIDVAKLFDN